MAVREELDRCSRAIFKNYPVLQPCFVRPRTELRGEERICEACSLCCCTDGSAASEAVELTPFVCECTGTPGNGCFFVARFQDQVVLQEMEKWTRILSDPLFARLTTATNCTFDNLLSLLPARVAMSIISPEARSRAHQLIPSFIQEMRPVEQQVRELWSWFGTVFRWHGKTESCPLCHRTMLWDGNTFPTQFEETDGLASQVDLFFCDSCFRQLRRPNFRDALKLLSDRRGTYFQWSVVVACCIHALGREVRLVFDFSPLSPRECVWVEYLADAEAEPPKWIPVAPSEVGECGVRRWIWPSVPPDGPTLVVAVNPDLWMEDVTASYAMPNQQRPQPQGVNLAQLHNLINQYNAKNLRQLESGRVQFLESVTTYDMVAQLEFRRRNADGSIAEIIGPTSATAANLWAEFAETDELIWRCTVDNDSPVPLLSRKKPLHALLQPTPAAPDDGETRSDDVEISSDLQAESAGLECLRHSLKLWPRWLIAAPVRIVALVFRSIAKRHGQSLALEFLAKVQVLDSIDQCFTFTPPPLQYERIYSPHSLLRLKLCALSVLEAVLRDLTDMTTLSDLFSRVASLLSSCIQVRQQATTEPQLTLLLKAVLAVLQCVAEALVIVSYGVDFAADSAPCFSQVVQVACEVMAVSCEPLIVQDACAVLICLWQVDSTRSTIRWVVQSHLSELRESLGLCAPPALRDLVAVAHDANTTMEN